MTGQKLHHYVPQFLLRNFADKKGKLWVLRKDTGKLFRASTESVFAETHLYSTIDKAGAYDIALENAYSKLESDAAPIVTRMIKDVRQGAIPTLSEDERITWSQFYYQQMKRVPEFHGKLDLMASFPDRLKEAIAKYEILAGVKLTDEQIADLQSEASLKLIKRNAVAQALADPGPNIMSLLMKIGLEFGRADAQLIIGSQPIARVGEGQSVHLLDPKVEAWLPLGSDVAVRPLASTVSDALVTLTTERVDKMNRRIFEQSSAVAATDDATLAALLLPPT